jgi:hypothetical protein
MQELGLTTCVAEADRTMQFGRLIEEQRQITRRRCFSSGENAMPFGRK